MGLREFLRLPKNRPRKRSKAKSEIGPIEGSSQADLTAQPRTESTPNLQIDASTSQISGSVASNDKKLNGMQIVSSQVNKLTSSSREADYSTTSNQLQSDGCESEGTPFGSLDAAVETTAGDVNENKSSLRILASGAKFMLRGVRDTADAFGPLKSVAGGLCFILENCEVYLPFHVHRIQR